jgi:hypothetical protein
MKKIIYFVFIIFVFSACHLFHKTEKNGCPTSGKNVDAGKLAVDDPKAKKDAQKAPKFKANKDLSGN